MPMCSTVSPVRMPLRPSFIVERIEIVVSSHTCAGGGILRCQQRVWMISKSCGCVPCVTCRATRVPLGRGRSGRSMKTHVTPSPRNIIQSWMRFQCIRPLIAIVLVMACSSTQIHTKVIATSRT